MKQYICVGRTKSGAKTTWYYLQESQSKVIIGVRAEDLKTKLINKEIEVFNLKLTKDNKIREKQYNIPIEVSTKIVKSLINRPNVFEDTTLEEVEKKIAKGNLLGKCKQLKTACNHYCYAIQEGNKNILYIPKNVVKPVHMTNYNSYMKNLFQPQTIQKAFKDGVTTVDKYLMGLRGHLQVVGGEGIKDYSYMFYGCYADSIDLSLLNTSNAEKMDSMFVNTLYGVLDLKSFDFKKVKTMKNMFDGASIGILNLASFHIIKDTHTNVTFMFYDASINTLIGNTLNKTTIEEELRVAKTKCKSIIWI